MKEKLWQFVSKAEAAVARMLFLKQSFSKLYF
jgi:hypothetical protein